MRGGTKLTAATLAAAFALLLVPITAQEWAVKSQLREKVLSVPR